MEQKLVDNPVSFLLRLIIGLRHENLNTNRENFILEATNLTRNQAASIWDHEIFNSWGEACDLQVMAQILSRYPKILVLYRPLREQKYAMNH